MVSLERCIGGLRFQEVEADGPGFRLARRPCPMASLASEPVSSVHLWRPHAPGGQRVSWDKWQSMRPAVGRTHIDDANSLQSWPRWLDPEEARGLAGLHAAPELLLGGQEEVLVEGVGMNSQFHPFSAAW